MTLRRMLAAVLAAASCAAIATAAIQGPVPQSLVTSPSGRAAYLAHAVIWRDPGSLSPTDLREGPPGAFPYTLAQATDGTGISCVYATPGKALAGKSSKFSCRTADGITLRLKYWDAARQAGNRETFAMVAATRLMWALGFMAMPALPMNIQCEGCPEDPMRGAGTPQLRRYVAMWQVAPPGARIVSGADSDQGWSWRELGAAIDTLPAGDERTRQRTHYAALSLLGVLLQHGDRKPEQQALYCLEPLDPAASEPRAPADAAAGALSVERSGVTACARAAVAIVDVGATFGGAGRTSNATTAKMHLESWRKKPVFESGGTGCRGAISISLAAGSGGDARPAISEEGRRFLASQLHRLTPDHLRAIFTAARVDLLNDRRVRGGRDDDAAEAWVAAFRDKVRQIDERRCESAP